jgi:hypothetical protein
MNNEKLKKELHELIDNTEDEELLNMVKDDIIAYQTESKKDFDDLSDLTPEQRAELEELATEDPDKDTISYEEFLQNIDEWRSQLLQKRGSKTE